MTDAFTNIIVTILIAGIVGGIAAYLAEPRIEPVAGKPQPDPWKLAVPRFVFLGVVASACVPLFLSLLQSDIIGRILARAAAEPAAALESHLLLAGFCLIAAFSARRFLDTVTAQVLRKAEQAQRDAAEAKARAAGAERKVETVAEVVDEQDARTTERSPAADAGLESVGGLEGASLRDPDRRILDALAQKTFRTATGLAADVGVGKHQIGELLDDLAERGLVTPTTSPNTGGRRWQITPAGAAALGLG